MHRTAVLLILNVGFMLKQFLERKGLSYLAKVRLAGLKPAPFLLINYKFAEIVFS